MKRTSRRHPTQTIVLSNQKGGVGKTTLTRELGIYLASTRRTVLIIDFDPQGNLTKSLLGMGVLNNETTVYNALEGNRINCASPFSNEEETKAAPLEILTSDIRLASLEKTLLGEMDAYTRLKDLLSKELFKDYDYILIDSPPSLGILSINALVASNYYVIPMNPALYTMQGTNDLMSTVEKVKRNYNPDLKLLGVIINEFDKIPVITREIKTEIEAAFGSSLFNGVLSRSIKVEEAISERIGLIHLPDCKVKQELILLGLEFIDRVEGVPLEDVAL